MFGKKLYIGLAVLVLLMLGILPVAAQGGNPGAPSGNGVVPIYEEGNPTCADFGYGTVEFKLPGITTGTYTSSDGVVVDLTVSGTSINWSANIGMDAVFVKGGPAGNLYVYNPEAISDTALHPPVNPNGSTDADRYYGISHISFCYDIEYYTLQVAKTANGSFTRTYTWDLTKDWSGTYYKFIGDPLTSHAYHVVATKHTVDSAFAVNGDITITNPAPYPVSFTLSDLLSDGTPITPVCPTYTIPGSSSVTCPYNVALGSQLSGSNTATVASLHPFVYGNSTTVPITWTMTEVGYSTVHVTDNGALLETISDSDYWDYSKDFTCPTDQSLYVGGIYSYSYPNTASITETGQSDSETVTVHCYAPIVWKDAHPSYHRDYTWTINKTADGSYDRFIGESVTHPFSVSVVKSEADSLFKVSGSITVTNPNPNAPMLGTTVSDQLDVLGSTVNVSCPDISNIPAGGTVTCTYEANLPSKTNGNNTATATFNGISFPYQVGYAFGDPTSVTGPASVTVTDTNGSQWEDVASDAYWPYNMVYTCSIDRGMYVDGTYSIVYPNTATIVETGQASSVNVTLNCYMPVVNKTAETSYNRYWDWTIEKSADQTTLTLMPGELFAVNYTVEVNASSTDADFLVAGEITVKNPKSQRPDE